MIITLVKADFSAKNVGTLSSFAILTNILNATYEGPAIVEKGNPFTATITMNEGYVPGDIVITMGGVLLTEEVSINGSIITINIASVTGAIALNVSGLEWTYPTVTWFDGSLASATGLETADANRVRTGYISISDVQGYITVPIKIAKNFIISCYDSNKTYLGQLTTSFDGVIKGQGQWIPGGTQVTPAILDIVENLEYIRVIADSESAGVQFIMNGQVLDTWNPEDNVSTSGNDHFKSGTLTKEDGKEIDNATRGRTDYIVVNQLTGTDITVKECNFIVAGFAEDGSYLGQYSPDNGDFDLVACQTSPIWVPKTTQVPLANLSAAKTIRIVAETISTNPYIYIDGVKATL